MTEDDGIITVLAQKAQRERIMFACCFTLMVFVCNIQLVDIKIRHFNINNLNLCRPVGCFCGWVCAK